jgi:hypothetical protein
MGHDANAAGGRRRDADAAPESHALSFVDRAGVVWRAYERRRPGQRPALVFESPHAVRLVRDYPDNWYTLPTAALEALSWSV